MAVGWNKLSRAVSNMGGNLKKGALGDGIIIAESYYSMEHPPALEPGKAKLCDESQKLPELPSRG